MRLESFLYMHTHKDQRKILSPPQAPKDPKTFPSSSEHLCVKVKKSCTTRKSGKLGELTMATVLILALKVQYIYYNLVIKLIRCRENDSRKPN